MTMGRGLLLFTVLAASGVSGGCNALTGASALEAVDDAPIDAPAHDGGTVPASDAAPGDARVEPADAGGSADASPDGSSCAVVAVGPRYGTAASGTWGNVDGALSPDGSAAHSNGLATPITVGGFGFSIPQGATIVGLKVDVARVKSSGTVSDKLVAFPGSETKTLPGEWPIGLFNGPFVTASYGGPTDTWGAALTPDDVNAPKFGVALAVSGDGNGHVDSIGATVFYCPP